MGETRRVVERWWELFESRAWDEMERLVAPDCVWIHPDRVVEGADEIQAVIRSYADAFPDARHEVERVVETGERIAMEVRLVGTHAGVLRTPLGDVPPTGRALRFEFCDVIAVRDGAMVEVRSYYDTLAVPAQLGLLEGVGR